ncbi:MAG: peptidylprolyl isomerase [Epsilonproteobacteria bacterium]|nr:peptidylprolyl isomerase [Campylobacterota bacterium]
MNNVYSVEYTVKNKDGEVLDSNVGQAPLEFISNKEQMIPAFEKAVEEMEVGEEKTVEVASKDAYGEYREDLLQTLPIEQFEGIELQKGMTLYGQGPDGQTIAVTVKDFNDKEVTIDYNHPLAGEDLVFDIKLLNKREATADEVLSGTVGGGCNDGSCNSCGCHH